MSITQQIREVLAKAPEPLNIGQLLLLCDEAQTTTDIAAACYGMTKAGTLERKRPEDGHYQYRLASGSPSAAPDAGDDPNASEARASRVTPSPRPTGTALRATVRESTRSRSVALAVPGKAPPAPQALANSRPVEPDLQIAITEAGVLALRRGEVVMYLSPDEQARIEAFSRRFRIVN